MMWAPTTATASLENASANLTSSGKNAIAVKTLTTASRLELVVYRVTVVTLRKVLDAMTSLDNVGVSLEPLEDLVIVARLAIGIIQRKDAFVSIQILDKYI